jgi:hypothetical protein
MFRVLSVPIIRCTLKLQMQSQVQVMCRSDVGLNPLKDVQGQGSISLYHGKIGTNLVMT